jgi:hypothetical protein
MPPDLAGCTPVLATMATNCAWTATCGGHTYEVSCVQGGVCCTCYTDGKATSQTVCNYGGTCSINGGGNPAWHYECNFP